MAGPPTRAAKTAVYFIQGVDGGPVKIGWAANPKKRLLDLQIGSPVKLRILGTIPGGRHHEAFLHKYFAEWHVRGEWFDPPADKVKGIISGKNWPRYAPIQMDLDAPAPNPNHVDMTPLDWGRRKQIEEWYENGMTESAAAAMLGWSIERHFKEMHKMAKLGYFRGVRLNLRGKIGTSSFAQQQRLRDAA